MDLEHIIIWRDLELNSFSYSYFDQTLKYSYPVPVYTKLKTSTCLNGPKVAELSKADKRPSAGGIYINYIYSKSQ